ncbi:PAS domain S-box protein [Bacteroidales bacterium AH-315-I05]|nr:PAS domain S-box protein [Bacteroidales bacterium AH-315-I05]
MAGLTLFVFQGVKENSESLETLSTLFEKELEQVKTNSDKSIKKAKDFITIISILFILISIVVVVNSNRIITNFILKLKDFTNKIAMGDFTKRIAISSNDEIGELAEAFNHMVNDLQKNKDAVDKFSIVVSKTDNSVIITDKRGKIEWVNEGFERITGYTFDEVKGTSGKILRRGNPTGISENDKHYIKAITEKQTVSYETQNFTKDGREFNVYTTLTPILDNEGNVEKLIAIDTEITEKKQLERELIKSKEKLQESEELYRTIVNSLSEGILITDKEDRITYTNNSMVELTGYSKEKLIGSLAHELLIASDDSVHTKATIEERMKQRIAGKDEHYEIKIKLKNGTKRWLKVYAAPYKSSSGEIIGTIGVNMDVTESKAAEQALKESEKKYRAVVNQSTNCIYLLDVETNTVMEANPAMHSLLGYKRDELIGRPLYDFVAHEKEDINRKIKTSLEKKEYAIGERQYRTQDGMLIDVEVSAYSITYENREAVCIVSQDITQRKKVERELIRAKDLAEQSVEAKEHFLANMSHEIRTPMNAIVGMAKLLYKTGLNEKQLKYLKAINISSKNLLVIINDILDISKIEAGKLTLETIGFKVESIIKSLINSLEYKAIQKDIYITYDIDEKAKQVILGDPVRLNQILLNLTNNAIKFTNKGKVEINCNTLKEDSNQITLEFIVTDTGIGIPAGKLETIFESFHQADEGTTRKYGGTGLGLTICKKLVDLQDGEISVESEQGEGAIFRVKISYKKGTEDDLVKTEKVRVSMAIFEGVKVLLVEDHELNQFMATTMLEEQGFEVDVANNGKIAIEKLKEKQYDIILMDVQMPVMGGIEATKIIRKNLSSKIPIIALTANALKGDREKYLAVGMNEYISKPFDPDDLYEKIANLLNGKTRISHSNSQAVATPKKPNDFNYLKEKPYDLSMLQQLSRGNDDFIQDMVKQFVKLTPESLTKIDKHVANEEWDRVRAVSHAMKPSIDLMGIHALKQDIRLIEQYADEKTHLEQIPQLVEKLVNVCNKVMNAMEEEIIMLSK